MAVIKTEVDFITCTYAPRVFYILTVKTPEIGNSFPKVLKLERIQYNFEHMRNTRIME